MNKAASVNSAAVTFRGHGISGIRTGGFSVECPYRFTGKQDHQYAWANLDLSYGGSPIEEQGDG